MRSLPTANFYLDRRKPRKDGAFPLKLRISFQGESKYFKIGVSLTEDGYQAIIVNHAPRGNNKILKDKFNIILEKANGILDKMSIFRFDDFEILFYQKKSDETNVVFYFLNRIKEFKLNGQLSSAEAYSNALKKIYFTVYPSSSSHDRLLIIKNQTYKPIPFELLTVDKLKEIKRNWQAINVQPATQGIYFRNLRAIFNLAIKEGVISKEIYPFGKDRFQIQQTQNAKRFLTYDELKKIMDYVPESGSSKETALDFWLLSFFLQGLNINDILLIKNKDYNGDYLYNTRNKTKNLSDFVTEKRIEVSTAAQIIISKYKTHGDNPEDYLFPFLLVNDNLAELKRKIKNFTRLINQHMKKIVAELDIKKPVSTYYARHTFASIANNKKIPTSEIQEALGHSSITTTQRYLSSLKHSFGEDFYENIFPE